MQTPPYELSQLVKWCVKRTKFTSSIFQKHKRHTLKQYEHMCIYRLLASYKVPNHEVTNISKTLFHIWDGSKEHRRKEVNSYALLQDRALGNSLE
jgi:hypothetical protein